MTKLFFSYSHADEDLRDILEKHLAILKRQGFIDTWHDRCIKVGDELNGQIEQNLEDADVILLLVSADFLASNYCYDVEMQRAIERHNSGQTRVIPVILRHCDWHDTPFGKLLAAPRDGKPVKSWTDLDEAFLDVVNQIKAAVRETSANAAVGIEKIAAVKEPTAQTVEKVSSHLSRNLHVRKDFSEADRDNFLEESFTYIATFFENSLSELEKKNDSLTTKFRRIDADRFTAVIYRDGQAVSRCKIMLRGVLGNGISYSSNDRANDNSFNENLSVEADDQNMYLKSLGMQHLGNLYVEPLSFEGAAEYYWSMLIQRIQ